MGVGGGHQRHAHLAGDLDGHRGAAVLDVQPVVLEFDVEVVAERLGVPPGQLLGRLAVVLQDVLVELAGQAAAQADQPLRVGGQHLPVDAGAVVEALQEGDAGQLDQVLEAGAVLGQQGEVAGRLPLAAAGRGRLGAAVAGGQVRLVAEHRVDAVLVALGVELDGRVQVAVVGDGARRHAQLLRLLDQRDDAVEPVEQGVVGVQVQVGELGLVGHACGIRRREHAPNSGRQVRYTPAGPAGGRGGVAGRLRRRYDAGVRPQTAGGDP